VPEINMTLDKLKVGQKAVIINSQVPKLLHIGLVVGSEIELISKTGSCIEIMLYGSKFAISLDTARNIVV